MLIQSDLSLYQFQFKQDFYLQQEQLLNSDLISASEKRKSEFCAGRFAAISAAKEVGIDLSHVGRGEKGEPVWPIDIVGSISHSLDYAIGLVGKASKYKSVGIDIEMKISEKKIPTLDRMVLTDNDKIYLETLNRENVLDFYHICFTAKEAFYKLIYPLAKEYFDFREASVVNIDFCEMIVSVRLHSSREALSLYNGIYTGNIIKKNNTIIVYFYLLTND